MSAAFGGRGGAAEDAELLAELMAISNRSSGNRFETTTTDAIASGGNGPAGSLDASQTAAEPAGANGSEEAVDFASGSDGGVEESGRLRSEADETEGSTAIATADEVAVAVAASEDDGGEPAEEDFFPNMEPDTSDAQEERPAGFRSDLPSTFSGDRGGAAEDADLLAELRAISNKSSTDRFASSEDDAGSAPPEKDTVVDKEPEPAGRPKKRADKAKGGDRPLPPWKRKAGRKMKAEVEVDVVVAAPAPTRDAEQSVESSEAPIDSGADRESVPPQQDADAASAVDDGEVAEEDFFPNMPSVEALQGGAASDETGGLKSDLPSTFSGDRGGAAEDADLLAELRAISNKSSTDRFASSEDDDGSAPPEKDTVVDKEPETAGRPKKRADKARPLPPWKRKAGRTKKAEVEVDVVVAAPAPTRDAEQLVESSEAPIDSGAGRESVPPQQDADAPSGVDDGEVAEEDFFPNMPSVEALQGGAASDETGGLKSDLPSTFSGDRGGAAEDADLLAELRAISNKSSTDRFASSEDDAGSAPPEKDTVVHKEPEPAGRPKKRADKARPLPPWKRKAGRTKKADVEVDVVVAAPAPTRDAEQLVESSEAPIDSGADRESVPPQQDADAASAVDGGEVAEEDFFPNMPSAEVLQGGTTSDVTGGLKSDLPSTFSGDRGGAAEDADLLAELRAISNKSSTDRFASGEDDAGSAPPEKDTVVHKEPEPAGRPKKRADKARPLPPWKRKAGRTKKAEVEVDVVVAAPAPTRDAEQLVESSEAPIDSGAGRESVPPQQDADAASAVDGGEVAEEDFFPNMPSVEVLQGGTASDETGGLKSDLPSTFSGDRGGAAEDADLLAELRAISNKSSAGRFAGSEGDAGSGPLDNDTADGGPGHQATASEPGRVSKAKIDDRPLPPWKQTKGAKKNSAVELDVVVAATAPAGDDEPTDEDLFPNMDTETAGSLPGQQEDEQTLGGLESDLPNTFSGDRGGSAEDAALLAELRAISNKTSTDRFVSENDAGANPPENDTLVCEEPQRAINRLKKKAGKVKGDGRPLPPWKRKASKKSNSELDVIVAAPGGQSIDPTVPKPKESANEPKLAKTFSGDRGGAAEDAELLAELMAISSKSSADRFANDESESSQAGHSGSTETGNADGGNRSERSLPSGKREGAKTNLDSANVDVAVPAQEERNNYISGGARGGIAVNETPASDEMGIKSNLPNTFTGDRGGAAEDADLLAELRSISSKSHTDRFAEAQSDNTTNAQAEDDKPLPPWKRKGAKKKPVTVDPVVAFPEQCTAEDSNGRSEVAVSSGKGITSDLPNTFRGDRGGSAEDADLLAELRAVSNKSSADRFADEGDVAPLGDPETALTSGAPALASDRPAPKRKTDRPWKRKGDAKRATSAGFDVVVAAPPAKSSDTPTDGSSATAVQSEATAQSSSHPTAIKSTAPKTFTGDRGGAAEDEELLAELRAISNSASNRFDASDGADTQASRDQPSMTDEHAVINESSEMSREKGDRLPPWERKSAREKVTPSVKGSSDVVATDVALPQNQMKIADATLLHGINSSLPNTFHGDRGGAAEDADLLAELRAVSMNSSSGRFNGEKEKPAESSEKATYQAVESKARPSTAPTLPKRDPSTSGGITSAPPDTDIKITDETLEESLKSSKWQVRKASYSFLRDRITIFLSGNEPASQLISCEIHSALDASVPTALMDKIAGPLDEALLLSVLYADCCQGARLEENARKIMASLVKGNAFASSKTSTLNSSEALVLKLIEVSDEGSATIETIFELIQDNGLKSRKPKAVLFSAKLILKAVESFGATVLPISRLTTQSEILIAHSNAQAREVGMKLLAELCRALGSKSPLQSSIDKLKPSQISQLESLLKSQPSATQITRRLRCKMGEPESAQSPEEALAALKMSQAEDEAKRQAARPAIDLFRVLPKTCYREKIKLDKWSEKVAALNALIDAGGEQPYKLVAPSGSVDYAPLIRELRQVLGHTHFAVCSKALAALGMLAEGVGAQLFSNLRPLLTTLLALFKDKKVCNAAGSSLDKMFANVFSFEHLLEANDSIPSSLDEKKQKNALVRKSALEYLARCVKSNGTYGTRGQLRSRDAEELAKLSCQKLNDSDASTRKAANGVLVALLSSNDSQVVEATKGVTESSLKTSNPRAYKSLQLASGSTNGGMSSNPSSRSRPVARPKTAPAPTSKPDNSASHRATPIAVSNRQRSVTKNKTENSSDLSDDSNESTLPAFDDAVSCLSALGMPNWDDEADEDGNTKLGILRGIASSNWKERVKAISHLTSFYKSEGGKHVTTFPSLFVLVRDSTKSFKESNFNVARALLEMFTAIFDVHATLVKVPESCICVSATKLAVEKVGDRKLNQASAACLNSLCAVKQPSKVLAVATRTVGGIKSPLVHEALLGWFKSFCSGFGVSSLSTETQHCLIWILKEVGSNNMKVRKSALDLIGEVHAQLGPALQSFVKTRDLQANVISLVDKSCAANPYNPGAQQVGRPLKCLTAECAAIDSTGGESKTSSSLLSAPALDLVASLKCDCIAQINSTEGKNSWKLRKEGMDNVSKALERCGGQISTEGKAGVSLKQLVLALRSSLSDSQSNLKPVAASLIGNLLSHLDDEAQAKFGKTVFPALCTASMNDIKASMRNASLSALSLGTERSQQDGGGTNQAAVETLIMSLESVLSDAALKSSGLGDLLSMMDGRLKAVASKISPQKQLSKVIVLSLLSSKTGSRAAAEKLLSTCSEGGVLSCDSLDEQISKLLPAQQRTLRAVIPKHSTKDKELIATFKKSTTRARNRPMTTSTQRSSRLEAITRPSSASLPPTTATTKKSSPTNELPHNPLEPSSTRSLKSQRLGRNTSWPDYPEEPSGISFQSLQKVWSQLVPSTASFLFPKGGIKSHQDSVNGCVMLTQALEYSKNHGHNSFIDQLDLIFRWCTIALLARDHTAGLRSLLSLLLLLFERLSEVSYVMSNEEASILLPHLLDKCGVAKSQFKDQFLNVISYVRSSGVCQTKEYYGPVLCMTVVDKSKFASARALAANECRLCVESHGVTAISKKGIRITAKALSSEYQLLDMRNAYLSLLEAAFMKFNDSPERLLQYIDRDLNDKTRELVLGRCVRPNPPDQSFHAAQTPEKRRPSRTSNSQQIQSDPPPTQLASSAAKENLRQRLQNLKDGNHRSSDAAEPKSMASRVYPERSTDSSDIFSRTLNEIEQLLDAENLTDDPSVVRGATAINYLLSAMISDPASRPIKTLSDMEVRLLGEGISFDFNNVVETVTGALKFSFHASNDESLPVQLINSIITLLSYLFKLAQNADAISQSTLEYVLRESVQVLLDPRLSGPKYEMAIMRPTNKFAMRAAMAPSRDTALSSLIMLQKETITSSEGKYLAKQSRVYTKLYKKVIADEYDKNDAGPLAGVKLDSMLRSLDWLLQSSQDVRSRDPNTSELLKSSSEMSRSIMLELIKCRGSSVRNAASQLIFPGNDLIGNLLAECESELGVTVSQPASSKSTACLDTHKESHFSNLINAFAQAANNGDAHQQQVALSEIIDFRNTHQSSVDFDAHLEYLSPQFRSYIREQLRKATKENVQESQQEQPSLDREKINSMRLNLSASQERARDEATASSSAQPVADKAASLRARLEALRAKD